jgi:hypothetical protein
MRRGMCALALTLGVAAAGGCGDAPTADEKIQVADATRAALKAGESRSLIIGLRDDVAVDPDEIISDAERGELLGDLAGTYAGVTDAVAASLGGSTRMVRRYDHLPFAVVETSALATLDSLAALDEVELIGDDEAHALGDIAAADLDDLVASLAAPTADATIAVLDSGVDLAAPRFGACQAAADDGCKVVAAADLAVDDGFADAEGRGTELAAAVLDRLPEVRLAALDIVGDDGRAHTGDLLAGIEWTIAHHDAQRIAGIALALGDEEVAPTGRRVLERALDLARVGGVGSTAALRRTSRDSGVLAAELAGVPPTANLAPTDGSVVINSVSALYTTTTGVNLTLNATGATQMCISNTTSCTAWITYESSKPWVLNTLNGVKTVRVWFRNADLEVSGPVSDTIILDRAAPGNGSFSSSPVAIFTQPTSITFTWVATACSSPTNISFTIDGVEVLNTLGDSGSCTCAPGIRTAVVTDPAAVAMIDDSNTFGVSFGAFSGDYLAWAMATVNGEDIVIFDYAPAGDAVARNADLCSSGYISGVNVTTNANPALHDYNRVDLSWNGFTDLTSGLDGYRLAWSNSAIPATCTTGPNAVTLPANVTTHQVTGLTEGSQFYARLCAFDRAGNSTAGLTLTDGIGALAAPPSPVNSPLATAVLINGGNEITSSRTVTLSIHARNSIYPNGPPLQMCISNSATCTAWESYAATKTHDLANGSGLRTVYARFRDLQGNGSRTPAVDTITIDVAAPANGRMTVSGAGGMVRLNWSGFSDVGSGIVGYRVVRGTGIAAPAAGCTGVDRNSGRDTLLLTDNTVTVGSSYSYRVCAVDGVGRVSSGVSAAVKVLAVTP